MQYKDTGKGKTYLVCNGAKRGMGCTIKTGYRYDDFEKSFVSFIDDLDIPSIINSEQHESKRLKLSNDIDACKGRITSLEQKIDELLELYERTQIDRVEQRLNGLNQQLVAAKATLEKLEQQFQALKVDKVALLRICEQSSNDCNRKTIRMFIN